jgi:hypothetical protein
VCHHPSYCPSLLLLLTFVDFILCRASAVVGTSRSAFRVVASRCSFHLLRYSCRSWFSIALCPLGHPWKCGTCLRWTLFFIVVLSCDVRRIRRLKSGNVFVPPPLLYSLHCSLYTKIFSVHYDVSFLVLSNKLLSCLFRLPRLLFSLSGLVCSCSSVIDAVCLQVIGGCIANGAVVGVKEPSAFVDSSSMYVWIFVLSVDPISILLSSVLVSSCVRFGTLGSEIPVFGVLLRRCSSSCIDVRRIRRL